MMESIFAALGVTALLWFLYRGIKGNPAAFTRDSISRSLLTMGVLGLMLIAVVAFAILMLKK
jgi:hypothetical protein